MIPRKYILGFFRNVLVRNHRLSYQLIPGSNKGHPTILGMLRVRNEALIIQDTLDSISKHVDAVIIFDDDSTDDTVTIARNHPIVKEIVRNKRWRSARVWEETANRRLLLKRARRYSPTWLFYFDADERYEGDIKRYLNGLEIGDMIVGIRIRLFDAYMTKDDRSPYKTGKKLFGFRKYFGIERRDILMIWRNNRRVDYVLPDSREPSGVDGMIETRFYCQHYGKALSMEQWEENCDYYEKNFPAYSEKWSKRRGKSIHSLSDFGTKLETWDNVKKSTLRI